MPEVVVDLRIDVLAIEEDRVNIQCVLLANGHPVYSFLPEWIDQGGSFTLKNLSIQISSV